MHLVPAPAVRLMKRRVLSRPGVNSLMVLLFHTPGLLTPVFSFLNLQNCYRRMESRKRNFFQRSSYKRKNNIRAPLPRRFLSSRSWICSYFSKRRCGFKRERSCRSFRRSLQFLFLGAFECWCAQRTGRPLETEALENGSYLWLTTVERTGQRLETFSRC